MSDPQRPHGLQPIRLLYPWDFPGKSTGVGCPISQQFPSWVYIWGKKIKDTNSKRYMHPNIHNSVIYDCHDTEATSVSINRGVDEDVVYIYIHIYTHTHTHTHTLEYYSVIKKNEMFSLGGHYAKSNKSEKDTHYMISLTCGI